LVSFVWSRGEFAVSRTHIGKPTLESPQWKAHSEVGS
jgi:hypothetical protein